ncbi:MAG: hypothetical protein LCH41_11165 [Armatimonadetes bacterium]|nr:hypothetical protein [Armatimonadota bacterium]
MSIYGHAKAHKQHLEIAANLLTSWHDEREKTRAAARKEMGQVIGALVVALVAFILLSMIEGGMDTKLTAVKSDLTEKQKILKGEVDTGTLSADDKEANRLLSKATAQNFSMLQQLGVALSRSNRGMALDSIQVEKDDVGVIVRGVAAAADLTTAYEYTADLTEDQENARAYLTNVERQQQWGPDAVKMSFELVQRSML